MHTKYQHGGDIYSNKVSIDYSANINPLGLPQEVKEELARCIEEPVCCVYPDSQCRDLVKALADYHKGSGPDLWTCICLKAEKSTAFSSFFPGI